MQNYNSEYIALPVPAKGGASKVHDIFSALKTVVFVPCLVAQRQDFIFEFALEISGFHYNDLVFEDCFSFGVGRRQLLTGGFVEDQHLLLLVVFLSEDLAFVRLNVFARRLQVV